MPPVTTLIAAAKELGATGAELVKYQNSGDATGDYSQVVAYAGVILKREIPGKEGYKICTLLLLKPKKRWTPMSRRVKSLGSKNSYPGNAGTGGSFCFYP